MMSTHCFLSFTLPRQVNDMSETTPTPTAAKCRNCGGADFYFQEVAAQNPYGLNLLPIGGVFSPAQFRIRICGDCGLVDWFVPKESLAAVKNKFRRFSDWPVYRLDE
jgi:hypothetical protein